MSEPNISSNFTIDDIHRIREYNYEVTKEMTPEERRAYYRKKSDEIQNRIEQLRAAQGKTPRNCTRI